MKVRALRGVCVGPGRDLAPLDEVDVDAQTAQYLVSIGAVERVEEPKPAAAPAAALPAPEPVSEVVALDPEPTPAKPGKKEK